MAAERIGSLALLVLGLLASAEALRFGLWTEDGGAGAGLFPLLLGLILSLISAAVLLERRGGEAPAAEEAGAAPRGKLWLYLGALVLYAVLLPVLGFYLCTILAFVLMLRFAEAYDWRKVVAITAGATFASYLVFERFLAVPMPRSILW